MSNELERDQKLGRWPGEQERQPLTDAMRELQEVAWRDCYGTYNDEEERPCKCEACVAKQALAAIESVLYPTVRSLSPERMANGTGYRERLYFEAWKHTNERRRGLNWGRGTLEILCESLGPITQRDMDVATAVVQWLGTSCGGSFVESVRSAIDRVHEEVQRDRHARLDKIHGKVGENGTVKVVSDDDQPADEIHNTEGT